ncbi:MAG: VanZ family protein [Planctomycetota bacterium]
MRGLRGEATARPTDFDPTGVTPSLRWGLLVWIVGVAYGSLIPFDLRSGVLETLWSVSLSRIAVIGPPTVEDVVVNLAVYAPLGVLTALAAGGRHRMLMLMSGGALGAVVSLGLELAQTAIASRVASWGDVFLNVLGVLLGVVGTLHAAPWFHRLAARARIGLRSRPFSALAAGLTLGLFLYHLAPFDFVTDTQGLHRGFLRARWNLFTAAGDGSLAAPLKPLVQQLRAAAWFSLLGYLLALAGREAWRSVGVSLASAIKHAGVVVLLIETLQIFTQSHVFDLGAIVLRIGAAGFGAWSAVFVVDALTGPAWRVRISDAFPLPLVGLVVAGQCLLMVAETSGAGGWSLVGLTSLRWGRLPFESAWRSSAVSAVPDLVAEAAVYGAMAWGIASLLSRLDPRQADWQAAGIVVVLCAGCEGLTAGSRGSAVDLTNVIMAAFSASVVVWARGALRGFLGVAPPATVATSSSNRRLERGPPVS